EAKYKASITIASVKVQIEASRTPVSGARKSTLLHIEDGSGSRFEKVAARCRTGPLISAFTPSSPIFIAAANILLVRRIGDTRSRRRGCFFACTAPAASAEIQDLNKVTT